MLVPQAMLESLGPLVPQAMLVPQLLLEFQAYDAFQIALPPGSTVFPQTFVGDHSDDHLQLLVNGRDKKPCWENGL